jgi:hypothetical protein
MPAPEIDTNDQGSIESTDIETSGEEISESQGGDEEQLDTASDEQAEEPAQDEEVEEGEEVEELEATPKEKSGNFDWKKINERLGNTEVERAFKESQRTISRYSQENKELKEQTAQIEPLREKAELFEWFDDLVRSNPHLRSQLQAVVSGGTPSAQPVQDQGFELPEEVVKGDPLVPIVMQLKRGFDELAQQSQQAKEFTKQQQVQDKFRQGLVSAKGRFKELVGRDMTEAELRSVAENMRKTNMLDGAFLVPSLFVQEITKSAERKFFASRKEKKNLPKTPSGKRTETSKQKSVKDAFDEAWAKEYGERD